MAPPHRDGAPAAGFQPSCEPDGQQDGRLQQLDGDDRDDLGAQEAWPPERGGAEPLEDAVAALEAGGDAERDHRGRHDGERQDPGHEEVRWGWPSASTPPSTLEKNSRNTTGMPRVSKSVSPRRSVM